MAKFAVLATGITVAPAATAELAVVAIGVGDPAFPVIVNVWLAAPIVSRAVIISSRAVLDKLQLAYDTLYSAKPSLPRDRLGQPEKMLINLDVMVPAPV
jgi:hypothetical protein